MYRLKIFIVTSIEFVLSIFAIKYIYEGYVVKSDIFVTSVSTIIIIIVAIKYFETGIQEIPAK